MNGASDPRDDAHGYGQESPYGQAPPYGQASPYGESGYAGMDRHYELMPTHNLSLTEPQTPGTT